jgi:hypothetical protein
MKDTKNLWIRFAASVGRHIPYKKLWTPIRNLSLGLWDQGPPKRFFRNFFVTRNAWGLFHKNSHISQRSGKEKVGYNTKASALKSAAKLGEKHNTYYSVYRCVYCGKYHLGQNRVKNL